jgi:hypothetical protein
VWLHWIKILWPEISPSVITGKVLDSATLKKPIVFGHYDILTHHRLTSLRPGTLIIDEAHALSNPKAKRTEAVLFYATVSHRVILLTGTPLWNSSKGLWSLLVACNPGAWGKLFHFAQRYCTPTLTEHGWRYQGVSNEDEWILRRDEIVICRRWEDVRSDLPATQRTTEIVDLDADQLRKVDQIAVEMRKNHTTLTVEDLAYYRQATGLYKVDVACDLATRLLEAQRDVVIWTWHKKVAKAIGRKLAKRFPTYAVTGDDTELVRSAAFDAWRASTTPAPLILTIPVGREGIDLSRAHHAIVVELDYTPASMSQAEMRTFSPDRPMEITYLVLDHDVDQALVDLVKSKVSSGKAIGMAAAGSTFAIPTYEETRTDEELLFVFRQAFNRT